MTLEHVYPRKIAAQELLSFNWKQEVNALNKIKEIFFTKIGLFNYVTPEENIKLRYTQQGTNFVSPVLLYKESGINLINITNNELGQIRKRDKNIINLILQRDFNTNW